MRSGCAAFAEFRVLRPSCCSRVPIPVHGCHFAPLHPALTHRRAAICRWVPIRLHAASPTLPPRPNAEQGFRKRSLCQNLDQSSPCPLPVTPAAAATSQGTSPLKSQAAAHSCSVERLRGRQPALPSVGPMAHASAMAATRVVADDMEARRRDEAAAARDMRESDQRSGRSPGGHARAGVPSFGRGLGDLLAVPDHETARRIRGDSMRLRLYALGDHLKSSDVGTGVLVNLSATLSWDAMRAILMNELFGDTIDISQVDLSLVSLHLLPDGERVRGPGKRPHVERAGLTHTHSAALLRASAGHPLGVRRLRERVSGTE